MQEKREDILGQALIAFGQGSGSLRVSRATSRALRQHFLPMATPQTVETWDEVAMQALERVRAMGRLAADYATREARTTITAENALRAAREVARVSGTSICDDRERTEPFLQQHASAATEAPH